MPYSKTIDRASSVTRSRSFAAPFVTAPKTICSAARPAEQHLHQVEELLLRVEVAVLLRRVERVAESVAPGDDRDLLHGLRLADEVGHERVAASW